MDPADGGAVNGGTEVAYAKLNLALHVRGRAADGYHMLDTLFVFAGDGDRLRLADRPGVRVEGPFAAALGGEADNIVTRAARAYADAFGGDEAGFALDKRLPVASGIGGGSADAAAALRLLCGRDHVAVDDPRVVAIARWLGADVPACLASAPARGQGRGDRLVPFAAGALAGMPLLLVNPRLPLSTAAVFSAWDGCDRGALPEGDPLDVALAGRNDLEAPARRLCPAIDAVLALLAAQSGVRLARMSGSGATCFALFDEDETRDAADAAIARARPDWWRLATRLRA